MGPVLTNPWKVVSSNSKTIVFFVFRVYFTLSIFSAIFMMSCRKNDPDLNECVRKSIEMLRPKLAKGIPELLVPPMEPLTIPEINIKQNAGAIRMESDYTDVSVSGLSNFTLRSVRIDTTNNKFRINLWFPALQMTANYHIHGKLLLMSLAGNGPCTGNFSKFPNIICKDEIRKPHKNIQFTIFQPMSMLPFQ